ncbi:ferritin [soil metagenome]
MKIPEPLAEAFNRQVTLELASSIAYVQLSAYFESVDLPGMAAWMRTQAGEERQHADKFMGHLIDRSAEVVIGDISGPEHDIASPLAAFETALAQERRVSEAIRDLYRLATEAGDIDALPLLQWFVAEQIEEEASVEEIIAQISRLGEDGSALLILDRELGQRQASVG